MMSQTPQGVEAQQAMVDITTNNYQKAIENFFSRYCSYALTVYFAELKGSIEDIVPTADGRRAMLNGGLKPENFDTETGKLKDLAFDKLATEYFVRTVPGSLVEMEDEKQLRILQQIYVPLSQAMPALASSGNQQALYNATAAMQFIVQKTIELSGSAHSTDLQQLWSQGPSDALTHSQQAISGFEGQLHELNEFQAQAMRQIVEQQAQQQEQMGLMTEAMGAIMGHLGISDQQTEATTTDLAV